MLLMLVAALALSSALDSLDTAERRVPHGLLGALQREPYQDGLVLASFGLAVAVLIWVVSAWSLAPLSRASREAAAAGPGHPGARISARHLPTEMRPLVSAVNAALDRLEAAYAAERRFTADAAHELRTPLAVLTLRLQRSLQNGAGAALDKAGIDQDLRQMTRLVTQLLDLARKQAADGTPGSEPHPINLCRIAREAAATVLPLAEAAGRPLALDLPDEIIVQGRAGDLRDMVQNLLENALAHGAGTISIAGSADGGSCTLDIADEGAGVPQALRQAVFERFRKAAPSSAGTGLGLAIVREVVVSHGGRVGFRPGPRCVVRVELPGTGASGTRT